MGRKSALYTALGLGSAATLWAIRRINRMLEHGAVRSAAGLDTTGIPDPGRTVTPVPEDTVTVTTVTTGDPAAELPARTWVVDNTSDWDGSPGELVIPSRSRTTGVRSEKHGPE